jgi:ankyrin repeat protein
LTAFTHSVAGVLGGAVPIAVAERFLDLGADVDEAANRGRTAGYTPLMMAVRNGHLELVRLLLEHGAAVDAAADDGATALSLADEADHPEILVLLERESSR